MSFFRSLWYFSGYFRLLSNLLHTTSLSPLLSFFLVGSPDSFLPGLFLDWSGLEVGVLSLDSQLSCSRMEERFSLLLPLSLLLLFLLFEELYFPSSFFILSRFLPLLLNPLFFFFSSSLRLSTQLTIYYFTLLDIGGPFKRFFNTFLACFRRRLSVDLWTFLWERGPSGEKESRLGESSVWMLRLWALGLRSEGWELRGWEECPRLRVCLRRLVTVCNLVLRMVVNMDSFRDCSVDY